MKKRKHCKKLKESNSLLFMLEKKKNSPKNPLSVILKKKFLLAKSDIFFNPHYSECRRWLVLLHLLSRMEQLIPFLNVTAASGANSFLKQLHWRPEHNIYQLKRIFPFLTDNTKLDWLFLWEINREKWFASKHFKWGNWFVFNFMLSFKIFSSLQQDIVWWFISECDCWRSRFWLWIATIGTKNL